MTDSTPGLDAAISERRDLDTEFSQLFDIMKNRSFRNGTNMGGEQAFYIYDYPPAQELEARQHIAKLSSRLQAMIPEDPEDYAPKVLTIDLYDVAIDVLEQRGVLNKVLKIEPKRHTVMSSDVKQDKFLYTLDNIIGADTDPLPNAIRDCYADAKEQDNADLVFITGVGKVYPIVRAHMLLEMLQGRIDDCPLVMFYPGRFESNSVSGSTMSLFGCVPAENYYRARSLREMIAHQA